MPLLWIDERVVGYWLSVIGFDLTGKSVPVSIIHYAHKKIKQIHGSPHPALSTHQRKRVGSVEGTINFE